jgi:tetratricopeptide (TPR) repeat protein
VPAQISLWFEGWRAFATSAVVCLVLGFALFLPRNAQAQAAPPGMPCGPAPDYACTLQQAVASALAIDYPLYRYDALRAIAAKAGRTAAPSAAQRTMISALAEGRTIERGGFPINSGIRFMVLSLIAAAQLEMGLRDEAAATLAGLPELAGPLSGAEDATGLKALGAAQASIGLKAEAAASFDQGLQLIAPTQYPHLCLLIAEALVAASMPNADAALALALQAAEQMPGHHARVRVIARVAAIRSSAGSSEEARRTFDIAVMQARSIEHPKPRNEVLLIVADELGKAGMENRALATLDEALQAAVLVSYPQQRLQALSQTAEAFVKVGQTAKAATAFADAVKAARAIASGEASGLPHRRDLHIGDASAARRSIADFAAARAGFDKASQVMWGHVSVLNVARAQAQAGLADDAMNTFRQAPESFRIDEAALPVTSSESDMRTVAKSSDGYDSSRAAALAVIAEALARNGLQQDALAQLDAAKRIAQAIAAPDLRATALASVARSQFAIGASGDKQLIADAAALLARALLDAQYSSPIDHDETVAEVIRTLIAVEPSLKAGSESEALFDRAVSAARSINNSWGRHNYLRSVVAALAASGRIARAMQVASAIQGPKERAEAWLSILKAMPN